MAEHDEQPTEVQEIVPAESGIVSLGDTMTTAQLRASTKKAQEQRAIITEYVKDHLVEGTDYGTIGSFKKNTLFKPGQEKIFSLMNLTSRLEKDADTLEMVGKQDGVVAYICRVYRKGEEIAQGRGAAKVGDNGRDINATIKIAEKRARMDACLSLGFSEFFTQDLEDPEYRDNANGGAPAKPASDKQRDFVKSLVKEALSGRDDVTVSYLKAFYSVNGIADPKNMTGVEASAFIEKAKAGKLQLPPDEEDTPDEPTAPQSDVEPEEGEIVAEPETEPQTAPAPLVNAQFRKDVEAKFMDLGMSVQDRMRIYREVWGQPFPPAAQPEYDKHWIAIDDYLNKVAEGDRDVD